MKKEITISVRDLIEYVMRSGNIDFKYMGKKRAIEGIRAHQKIQKSYGKEYSPEVYVKKSIETKDYIFTMQGRIDGVIDDENGVIIDEIKSTTKDISEIDENFNHLHWAQAKCYGYIYGEDNSKEEIRIQLTYYNIETEEIKKIINNYNINELKNYVLDIINSYLLWADSLNNWYQLRNQSINSFQFPFRNYRKGQRELCVAVYKSIKEQKKLYVDAPTGIGKTISVMFPSIKNMGEEGCEKIFYLTSKTTQRSIVEDTLALMHEKGLKIKSVTLTSKEKICFLDKPKCNPESCTYAKGHFNRVNNAISDIFANTLIFNRNSIETYAKKHQVCPFEFSLDLAIWSDIVICDYNYIFDPQVCLKRFTENKGNYTFLIDEAHNLVDRSKDMYSSILVKDEILKLRKSVTKKNIKLYNSLGDINKKLLEMKKLLLEENYYVQNELPLDLIKSLRKFLTVTDKWLIVNSQSQIYDDVLKAYFDINSFVKISEYYGENYVTYLTKNNNNLSVRLFCMDASYFIKESTDKGISSIFFSATLSPIDYFIEVFGGDNELDYYINLDSPFKKENLCIMICNNISTKYNNRKYSYTDISSYVYNIVNNKKGNYMVFFPSYEYMENTYEEFIDKYPKINIIKQSGRMNEKERQDFIDLFDEDKKELLAFVVLGGVFSEGIDLKGEKLIGTIIVSVGMPKIGTDRNLIKNYYDGVGKNGFKYAYMYPGMNKVMQAAGRVIRTEHDKGLILLIDERYTQKNYQKTFPKNWKNFSIIKTVDSMRLLLQKFWENDK